MSEKQKEIYFKRKKLTKESKEERERIEYDKYKEKCKEKEN